MSNFDREIDDAGLNQDSTFDRKDDENFDHADEFHKHDDTSKDQNNDSAKKSKTKPRNDDGYSDGFFDGNFYI